MVLHYVIYFHKVSDIYFDVAGVVNAYKNCIRQIQLYGPTNFSFVINHVAKFAATYTDGSQYFILLIVTDGVITDMEHTKNVSVSLIWFIVVQQVQLKHMPKPCTSFYNLI